MFLGVFQFSQLPGEKSYTWDKSTRAIAAKPHSVHIGRQNPPSTVRSLLFLVRKPSTYLGASDKPWEMFNNNWTVGQNGFEPCPKDRRQFESQENGHSEWWGKQKDFPPLVKSFHSYRLVDSRCQTLVGTKPIFEALVGESVAWKVERSKEFLNIAQWCSLWHLQARERTTMHTVKPFRGNTSPGPLASPCRLYVTKLCFTNCFLTQ